MSLLATGIEYKTLTADSPTELDRQVNEYLTKEPARDGWVCHWHLFGTQTVVGTKGVSGSPYYRYFQTLVLCRSYWDDTVGPDQAPSPDTIMSFLNS